MSGKKVNAKFTRTDDTHVDIRNIDEIEVIDLVHELKDDPASRADDVHINIGKVKKIDLIDDEGQEVQSVYGDKNNV